MPRSSKNYRNITSFNERSEIEIYYNKDQNTIDLVWLPNSISIVDRLDVTPPLYQI